VRVNRRKFLSTLIGGVAAAAAVRTFPFRVYSFPTELTPAPRIFAAVDWGFEPGMYLSIAGLDYRVDEHMPKNEVWLVREAKTQTIHLHEGPRAGQTVADVIKPGQILRLIKLERFKEKALFETRLSLSALQLPSNPAAVRSACTAPLPR
jgi:hypothetical protein